MHCCQFLVTDRFSSMILSLHRLLEILCFLTIAEAEGGIAQQRPQPMVAAALVQAALDAVQRVTAAGATTRDHADVASQARHLLIISPWLQQDQSQN